MSQLLSREVLADLFSVSAACVINLVCEDGAYITVRTRTVGIRCSYIRDQAVSEGLGFQLRKGALESARAKLGFQA